MFVLNILWYFLHRHIKKHLKSVIYNYIKIKKLTCLFHLSITRTTLDSEFECYNVTYIVK